MARTRTRYERLFARRVRLIPGDNESGIRKILPRPYRDPTLVPWISSLRSCRAYRKARELGKLAPYLRYKECLQLLRGAGAAGRSDKGVPTV